MLLINKPSGITSHDVVDIVRKKTGVKRVGHTGTLDPFAEGLLIVLVGREETKRQAEFLKLDKEYIATLRLGEERDTGDVTGQTQSQFLISNDKFLNNSKIPNLKTLEKALNKFTGEIEQIPPEYSAVKIKGKKAYELAREGKKVDLHPRRVTIHGIKVVEYKWPRLTIKTRVSSGTYIRALARDMGRELGVGAYVDKLVRTRIGKYKLEDATSISNF